MLSEFKPVWEIPQMIWERVPYPTLFYVSELKAPVDEEYLPEHLPPEEFRSYSPEVGGPADPELPYLQYGYINAEGKVSELKRGGADVRAAHKGHLIVHKKDGTKAKR